LLKNSNFFGRDSYNIMNFSVKFYSKIRILHEFTLKERPKVKTENFIGTKT